jgi:glycosyltransferase involved in cell wall biosynthesis
VFSPRGALEAAALQYGPASRKRVWLRAWGPIVRRATIFHATSAKEAESVRTAMGDDAQVRVVPNGVELPPEPLEWDEGQAPTIAFIGRIHRIKVVENLVDAVALLRARGHALRLEIAGPTPDLAYRQELLDRVARHGLDDVTVLRGEVRGRDKRRFYERSRVCVLPSSTENFGNVVIESLGHGVPVVASRFTPWSELEEARCGRWTGNSPRELADAIEPYVKSAALAREDGLRGRALVERRYTWTAVARSMIDVYREAIDRAAR